MMNATAASLDPDLAGGAIGYISALGQCGSALFPWITGALAGSYGVWALQRTSLIAGSMLDVLQSRKTLIPGFCGLFGDRSALVGDDRPRRRVMGGGSEDESGQVEESAQVLDARI
jgi:hypothetical protein